MSTVNNGPQIVRNGLILDLDAGNGKSYSTNRFQSYGSGLVTENVTFSLQGTGTFQRIASGTVIGGYTVRPNDVVYSYVLGVNGCHYHGNSAPVVAGTYATFSFDYLVTGATNYPSTDYLANFEGVANAPITTANSLQNVWQRRSVTVGPISTSGNLNMYLYPGACGSLRLADSGTIYYRNPKVEITNVDTGTGGFSSTSNIGLWYDLSGNGYNGTLNGPTSNVSNKGNILFNGSSDYVSGTTSGLVSSVISMDIWFNVNSSKTYSALMGSNATEKYEMLIKSGAAIEVSLSTNNLMQYNNILSLNTWTNIVVTAESGTQWKMYKNGVDLGSPTTYTGTWQVSGASISNFDLGRIRNDVASFAYSGNISTVKIYNRALSATEVLQNYNATKTRFGL